jgi:hypothetical protein
MPRVVAALEWSSRGAASGRAGTQPCYDRGVVAPAAQVTGYNVIIRLFDEQLGLVSADVTNVTGRKPGIGTRDIHAPGFACRSTKQT